MDVSNTGRGPGAAVELAPSAEAPVTAASAQSLVRSGLMSWLDSRSRPLGWPIAVAEAGVAWVSRRLAGLTWRHLRGLAGAPGSALGRRLYVMYPQRISSTGPVTIMDDVVMGTDFSDGTLRFGSRVVVCKGTQLDFSGGLQIEDFVHISEQAILYTHDHGTEPTSSPVRSPLRVGRRAWIGARAIILPNVRMIGEGAIIGAGAVVTREVPAWSVWAGNPARQVGTRPRTLPGTDG